MLARIIFPPQFEPFQPYLSGPYIKGLLREYGIKSACFDANVHFFNWLVGSTEAIEASSAHDHYLRDHAPEALLALRRAPTDIPRYRWAINVLDRYLELAARGSGRLGVSRFEIHDRFNSEALRAWAQSDRLFRAYFDFARDDLLGPVETSHYLFSLAVMDQLAPAIVLADSIRRQRPNAQILVGGPLVSRLHKQLRAIPWLEGVFDAVAPGEAYVKLPSLLGLDNVPAYSGHVTPDFGDCDWDSYWSCRRVLPYLVAHGCKWGKCTFCSHHLTYEGYRSSGMERVLDDLEDLARAHELEYVSFCDEYLTPAQLTALAKGVAERGLNLAWSTFARPEPAFKDPVWIRQLYEGGCRMLMFGLESGSQRILSAMRKGTRVANFRPILEACEAARIAIRYDFMVGFPGETREDVEATYDFICDHRELIDTPFSSYAVAAFELRTGVPVELDRQHYGVAGAELLRGDLDDQFEFGVLSGLAEAERASWRERFIRFAKEELAFDILCPQNKTDQLVFKDLYDQGVFALPPTRIDVGTAPRLTIKFAPHVTTSQRDADIVVSSPATGGTLELGGELSDLVAFLHRGGPLCEAGALQEVWDFETFLRFVNFLYRNDYVALTEARPSVSEQRKRKDTPICAIN